MFNNDQVSSAVWFFIGLFIIFVSLSYGLGSARAPHTGFMPFLIGLSMCSLAIVGIIDGTMEKRKGIGWKRLTEGVKWEKPLVTLSSLFVYVWVLKPLGFLLATALLVGFLLKTIQPQKWRVILFGAIFTSFFIYLIFQVWLQTQLPPGILFF